MGLANYVGCRRVVFVAQTATFCVVSATCCDTSLVMSQTQENVVLAGCPKRHDNVGFCQHVVACRQLLTKKYFWADLYLSAVIDINWAFVSLFCVATTRNVGQDLAILTRVGDMSAT